MEKDWAWQHVKGDVDYYDVRVPLVTPAPEVLSGCEYDDAGGLRLSAYNMRLSVPAIGSEANDSIGIKGPGLNSKFPDGRVHLRVDSITDQRGLYRLNAKWSDGLYYSSDGV